MNQNLICHVSDLPCHNCSDNYILSYSCWRCLCLELKQNREAFPVRSDCLCLHHRPGSGLGPRGLWEPRLLLDLHLWQTPVELRWSHSHCHTGNSCLTDKAFIFAFKIVFFKVDPNLLIHMKPTELCMCIFFLCADEWRDFHDCSQDFL